jgi:hypothetical protein
MAALKYIYILIIVLCVRTLGMGQINDKWTLPKHQIQAQMGMSNNTDFLGTINPFPNCPYLGATYYYNFSTKWYASFDYQFMQGTFKMGILNFITQDNKLFDAIKTYPSVENPILMPIVMYDENRFTFEDDIKNSKYVKVTSPNGLYRRTHYSLNGGYMRVTSRNMLRIGVGVSYFRLESRDILTNVVEYDKRNTQVDQIVSLVNFPYLRVLDIKDIAFNARIAYDFFLTQQLSVGLQLNHLVDKKGFVSKARQAGITVGYSPSFLKKKRGQPRV